MTVLRRSTLVVLPFLVVACSSVDPSPNLGGTAHAAATEGTIPRTDVERDLRLDVKRPSNEAMDAERDPRLEVWLVNTSATQSYPVVLANDGSDMGWREPHAYFDIELLSAAGTWGPPPAEHGARCGNYADEWEKDVVTLAPGQRVKMAWMPFPQTLTGDATKMRVVARYEYGASSRDKSKVPPVLHAMPEYAIRSAPLEIPIEHPYTLELKIKGALPTTAGASLASVLDVVVENHSNRTLPVGTSETGSQLWFEIRVAETDITAASSNWLFVETEPTYPSKDILVAGARRSIVSTATKTDYNWGTPRGKVEQVRAIWRIWDSDPAKKADENDNVRRVESPWVTVP